MIIIKKYKKNIFKFYLIFLNIIKNFILLIKK